MTLPKTAPNKNTGKNVLKYPAVRSMNNSEYPGRTCIPCRAAANIANTGVTITGNLSVSGNISGNTNGYSIGYLNIPQVSASNTTLALGDAGKSVQYVPLKDVSDVSACLKEVMDELKLDKVNLIGHSFGGGYAANFALSYPKN